MSVKSNLYFSLFILSLFTSFFASCKKEMVIPRASGRPYEVMVVMNDWEWEAKQGRALFAVLDTDIPGLPQPERSFHISQVDPKRFDSILNIFRNIILVDINKQLYTMTSMKFTRDKYAMEQIVLTIQSPSADDFADFCFDHGQDIIDFLTKMEMNRLVKELKGKYSKKTAELAKEIFDCEFHAPEEIKSYKKGENFFWTSSNGSSGMVNICMYSYPYEGPQTFNKQYVLAKRDSVMAVNIPGTLPTMHMATDTLCTTVKPIMVHNQYALEARGLWYMENDGMGGPFVSHSRVDTTRNIVIVVEGFVFAPEKMKRGLMRRLEGSLYTLNLPDEKTTAIVTNMEEVAVTAEDRKKARQK
ncbi:MAG: DUF4837 family protein [Bacteroidaceae bacterium]|nr:DUF4837 family protein [Bacteroidaceae bacterium]